MLLAAHRSVRSVLLLKVGFADCGRDALGPPLGAPVCEAAATAAAKQRVDCAGQTNERTSRKQTGVALRLCFHVQQRTCLLRRAHRQAGRMAGRPELSSAHM